MREMTKAKDRVLFGVAGGMAEYFEVDKSLMRAIWLISGIVVLPLVLAYLVMAIVIPAKPRAPQARQASQPDVIEMQAEGGDRHRTEFHARPPRKRMVKSYDRWISGVCGGIAEYFDVDPALIRALFVAAIFFGFGAGLLVYLILAVVMPRPEYQYR
jgi:phage shock protein C